MRIAHVSISIEPAGRSRSRLVLSATLPERSCAAGVHRLCEVIAGSTGHPVLVALPVGGPSEAWFDYWCDALATVPDSALELRFVLPSEGRVGTRRKRDQP